MTENELKQQLEFLQWKEEKQKYEEEKKKKEDEKNTCWGCLAIILILSFAFGSIKSCIFGDDHKEKKVKKEQVVKSENNESSEPIKKATVELKPIVYDKTNSVMITSLYMTTQPSSGAVDIYMSFKNTSDKTIKYFIWYGRVLNRVDDPVPDLKTGEISKRGRCMGPIEPDQMVEEYWSNMWYNRLAQKILITKVKLIYMDETSISIDNVNKLVDIE